MTRQATRSRSSIRHSNRVGAPPRDRDRGVSPAQQRRVAEARAVLAKLGFPAAQTNERSALVLLALLDLRANRRWAKASGAQLWRTVEIMQWLRDHYAKDYKPSTRDDPPPDTAPVHRCRTGPLQPRRPRARRQLRPQLLPNRAGRFSAASPQQARQAARPRRLPRGPSLAGVDGGCFEPRAGRWQAPRRAGTPLQFLDRWPGAPTVPSTSSTSTAIASSGPTTARRRDEQHGADAGEAEEPEQREDPS